MSIDTLASRKEITHCEEQAAYHDAMASKAYEERDPEQGAFHMACARISRQHARNLRALMIVFDFVEHIG